MDCVERFSRQFRGFGSMCEVEGLRGEVEVASWGETSEVVVVLVVCE